MNDDNKANGAGAPDAKVSARKFTYLIFLITLFIWLYSLWADRMTPMTDQGWVNGQVIRLSPQVSGPIAEVHVSDNAPITQGQKLVGIDKKPFELAVKAARLALDKATQSFDTDSAAVYAAKANQVAAEVRVSNARQHLEHNQELARRGIISEATLGESRSALDTAVANLAQATAALEKAEQELDPEGKDNPQVQTALNNLEQALLDLSNTDIKAPADGVITHMNLAAGNFARAGEPLLTFVNDRHMWLTVMVRENSLAHLQDGTPVKVVFEALPGQIFHGQVTSIGWGGSGVFDSPAKSPKAQRFPVNVRLTDFPGDPSLRYNGRAVVSFYPGESYIGERLLDLFTWVWSYLTYVS